MGKLVFAKSVNGVNTICTVNLDGSGFKEVYNLPAGSLLYCLKALKSGKVFYRMSIGGEVELWVINADGSGNTKIPFSASSELSAFIAGTMHEAAISREGKGFLYETSTITGGQTSYYSSKITSYPFIDLVYNDAGKKTVFEGTGPLFTASKPLKPILSDDGTQVAYTSNITATGFEISIKNISVAGSVAKPYYTFQYPTSGPGAGFQPYEAKMFWLDGNKRLLISYGKYSNYGKNDYTYCFLVDPATGISSSWTLPNEGSVRMAVN